MGSGKRAWRDCVSLREAMAGQAERGEVILTLY